jgi:hypothetical protein
MPIISGTISSQNKNLTTQSAIITSGLVCHYDLNNPSCYDWQNSPNNVNSLTGSLSGTIQNTPVNLNLTVPSSTDNVYGVDQSGDKFLYFYGGHVAGNNIYINSSINLTDWTACFRLKHRANIGMGYDRMLGTRNYRMELVANNLSQIWYYQAGWVNTGITIPNDGEFHDLDWTYKNSPKEFKIYLDGVLSYSTTTRGTTLSSSPNYWVMGAQDSRNFIQPLNRHLLYNRALTQSEIIQNLN